MKVIKILLFFLLMFNSHTALADYSAWHNLKYLMKEKEKEKSIWEKFLDIIYSKRSKNSNINNLTYEEVQQKTYDIMNECLLEKIKINSSESHKKIIQEYCGNKVYHSYKSRRAK